MCMNEWSVKSQHGNPSLTTLVAKTENIKSLPRNVFSDEDADTVDTSLFSVPLPCRILHLTSYVNSVRLDRSFPNVVTLAMLIAKIIKLKLLRKKSQIRSKIVIELWANHKLDSTTNIINNKQNVYTNKNKHYINKTITLVNTNWCKVKIWILTAFMLFAFKRTV